MAEHAEHKSLPSSLCSPLLSPSVLSWGKSWFARYVYLPVSSQSLPETGRVKKNGRKHYYPGASRVGLVGSIHTYQHSGDRLSQGGRTSRSQVLIFKERNTVSHTA